MFVQQLKQLLDGFVGFLKSFKKFFITLLLSRISCLLVGLLFNLVQKLLLGLQMLLLLFKIRLDLTLPCNKLAFFFVQLLAVRNQFEDLFRKFVPAFEELSLLVAHRFLLGSKSMLSFLQVSVLFVYLLNHFVHFSFSLC